MSGPRRRRESTRSASGGRRTRRQWLAKADWRRLIARVREVFKGPLTYSANFDGYARIRFWDALDVIGISAYFPLTDERDPSAERLAAAWDDIMTPLEAFARKQNRRVVFTEIGYPAVSSAAARPWEDARGPADVWLQARLYEAALRPCRAGRSWSGRSSGSGRESPARPSATRRSPSRTSPRRSSWPGGTAARRLVLEQRRVPSVVPGSRSR